MATNIVPPMLAPNLSTDKSVLEYIAWEQQNGGVLKYKSENSDKKIKKLELCKVLFCKVLCIKVC